MTANPEHLFEEIAIANEFHAMVSAFYDSAGHSAVKFHVIVDFTNLGLVKKLLPTARRNGARKPPEI